MNILGIETSTKTGSVAVVSDSGVVAQYSLNIEVTHSERLMATVDRVLRDIGMGLDAIDAFAVALGPGSFTGLRIGIATVKGLVLATNKPVVAVPTLKALAWALPYAAFPICAMLDARKKEVYAALYKFEDSRLVQIMTEAALPLAELGGRLAGKTIFTGEAAHLFSDEIRKQCGEHALFAPFSASLPSAAIVGEIGLAMIRAGTVVSPENLSPMYIRRPEAEVAWEKRQSLL